MIQVMSRASTSYLLIPALCSTVFQVILKTVCNEHNEMKTVSDIVKQLYQHIPK